MRQPIVEDVLSGPVNVAANLDHGLIVTYTSQHDESVVSRVSSRMSALIADVSGLSGHVTSGNRTDLEPVHKTEVKRYEEKA